MSPTGATIRRIEDYLAGRYESREYPSLIAQTVRFRASRPFVGRALLDCTPLFSNTLLKYVPLLAGGADLTVGVSERIPHDPEVVRFLESIGFPVLRDGSATSSPRQFDVILDCDGSRSDLSPRIGVCELTRSGIYHYAKSAFPVVLVDDSRIKKIETSVGTGDGFMRAMKRFGYTDWSGRKVVIFGCGKVGCGVAYRCAREGAVVTVVDRAGIPLERVRAASVIDCRDIAAVQTVVKGADFVVTATGVKGAMKGYGLGPILRERGEIVVAAIGIEDEWLDELDRGRIVNDGAAVNFALDEPTLLRYIDPTMALSNESAADLLRSAFTTPGIVRPSAASEALCLDPVLFCGLITEEIKDLGC